MPRAVAHGTKMTMTDPTKEVPRTSHAHANDIKIARVDGSDGSTECA